MKSRSCFRPTASSALNSHHIVPIAGTGFGSFFVGEGVYLVNISSDGVDEKLRRERL
jgi:hypothetical protein